MEQNIHLIRAWDDSRLHHLRQKQDLWSRTSVPVSDDIQ